MESSDSKFRLAEQFYRKKEFEKAFLIYQELAEDGSTSCQRFIAWMYLLGEGVQKDVNIAIHWMEMAANSGDSEAQFGMGRICAQQQRFDDALSWFMESEKQGFLPSAYYIAWMRLSGKTSTPDEEAAFSLLKEASEKGHIRSGMDYARCLIKGRKGAFGRIKGVLLYLKMILVVAKLAAVEPNSPRFLH